MTWVRRFAALAILATSLLGGPAAAGEVIAGVASAIDGDSLEIHGQQIRLHGIDAPEGRQLCEKDGERYRCGQVAARALAGKIDGRRLECDVLYVDSYGRAGAVCFLDGEDVNGWLVRQGHAVPRPVQYPRVPRRYQDEKQAARAAQRGVWAGGFVMPWRWRRGERL